ncbi:hypothetical protein LT493_18035 [Streptomyces tricolor]|nr:hypothetical protein [Streptomyces tricolor]
MLTSATRDALTGVETVILDEGARGRGHQARRASRALPGAAGRAAAEAGPPDQPVGDRAPGGRGGPVSVPAPQGGDRPAGVRQGVRPLRRRPGRGHGRAGAAPPAADAAEGGERPSIWPHVEERIADLVQAHRSTIVFANSRRLAERLCNRLNEIAYERATGETLEEHPLPRPADGRLGPGPGAPPGDRPRAPRLGLQGAARPGGGRT